MSDPTVLQQALDEAQQLRTQRAAVPDFNSGLPAPTTEWELHQSKKAREAQHGFSDYLGAMWRQDSPVDGLVAHIAGSQIEPTPGYSPFANPERWKELTMGLPEEYHKHFYDATSEVHAEHIKSMLHQKLDDMQKLGDLGVPGNIGRFAFGFIEPTSLLAGIASGGVTSVYRGVKGVQGAAKALESARKLEANASKLEKVGHAAGVLAGAAKREASKGAMAAGLGAAAVFGAGFEKLRQSVNFEDSTAQVLEAALVTSLFATPFVYLHGREMRKLSNVAATERDALQGLKKLHDGEEMTPEQKEAVVKSLDYIEHVQKFETGEIEAGTPPERKAWTETYGRQRHAREENFDALEASAEAQKQRELDDLWADGHMAKEPIEPPPETGKKDRAVSWDFRGKSKAVIDDLFTARDTLPGAREKIAKTIDDPATLLDLAKATKGEAPTVMELAFMRASLKKRKAEAEAPTPEAPAEKPTGSNEPQPKATIDPPEKFIDSETWWVSGDSTMTGTITGVTKTGKFMVEDAETGKIHVLARDELDVDAPGFHSPDMEGFLHGSVGSGQRIAVDPLWAEPSAFANTQVGGVHVRQDAFAVTNRSENLKINELGFKMIKDGIGISEHYAQGWTASEHKKQLQRQLGGYFHYEAREAFNEVRRIRNLGWVAAARQHKKFYEDVTKVAAGDTHVLITNEDIRVPLQRAAKAMRYVLDTMGTKLQEASVLGAEHLVTGGNYVNRVWNYDHIRTLMQKHGEDAIYKLVADAIQVPKFKGDLAKAKSFLLAVRKLEFSHSMQDIQLLGRDMGTLRKELSEIDPRTGRPILDPEDIDTIVDLMFSVRPSEADAGRAGNLKFRFDLDENTSVQMADGSRVTLRDLLENDSRLLIDRYLNSMAGHYGMAKIGIHSKSEFISEIGKADKEHLEKHSLTGDASQYTREKQVILDAYNHITGRPMSHQTFHRGDRLFGMGRAYTRSALLGQLGLAAAFELKNAIGLATFRASWQQMPSLRGFINMVRTGKIPNEELAQSIRIMSGFGYERAMSYARQHEITDFTYDKGLSRFEDMANQASHAVDLMSGNAHFTAATRHLSAAFMMQKHFNMASGKLKLTPKLKERLVHQGLDADDIEDVFAHLSKFADVDGTGTVKNLRWEEWQANHPGTYDKYLLLLNREVRDAIQDHDFGETMPWMHTTVGKIFAELRTFMLVGHTKQFLKGAHYRDQMMAQTWMFSFIGELLSYALQQSINFAHDPDELRRRMTPERMASGAIQRMSVLGVMPAILETGYWIGSGGDSLFRGGTVNTDNRNLLTTPSLMQAGKLMGGVKTVGGMLNPFSDSVTTEREMSQLMGGLPGGNLWGIRTINSFVSSHFPKSEPPQQ